MAARKNVQLKSYLEWKGVQKGKESGKKQFGTGRVKKLAYAHAPN